MGSGRLAFGHLGNHRHGDERVRSACGRHGSAAKRLDRELPVLVDPGVGRRGRSVGVSDLRREVGAGRGARSGLHLWRTSSVGASGPGLSARRRTPVRSGLRRLAASARSAAVGRRLATGTAATAPSWGLTVHRAGAAWRVRHGHGRFGGYPGGGALSGLPNSGDTPSRRRIRSTVMAVPTSFRRPSAGLSVWRA